MRARSVVRVTTLALAAATVMAAVAVARDVCAGGVTVPKVGDDAPEFRLRVIYPEPTVEGTGFAAQIALKAKTFVNLADYVGPSGRLGGKRLIILAFFASWCEPCKREMPFNKTLHDLYRFSDGKPHGDASSDPHAGDGVLVLSVTIDKEDDKIAIAADVARQNRANFPVLSDKFNIVARRYAPEGGMNLPCVYIIGGDGKIQKIMVGDTLENRRTVLAYVRRARGEPQEAPVPEALAAFFDANNMHHGPAVVATDVLAIDAFPPAAAGDAVSDAAGDAASDAASDADAGGRDKPSAEKKKGPRGRHPAAPRGAAKSGG